VTEEKLFPKNEDHFSTYTTLQRLQQSYYKKVKVTLHNWSILATTWHWWVQHASILNNPHKCTGFL